MKYLFLYTLFLLAHFSFSQELDWRKVNHPKRMEVESYVESDLSFIDLSVNNFKFHTERSPNFEIFFKRMAAIKAGEYDKLNIYHIGGSHIQADAYSNVVREGLQTYSNQPGERGYVFPYNLAGTNNPSNYRITSANKFEGKRIVGSSGKDYDLGMFGAAIVSKGDSTIEMEFKYRTAKQKPCFNEVAFFRNKGEWNYEMNFGADEILIEKVAHVDSLGWTKVTFCDALDSLDVQFRERVNNSLFEFYGMGLLNTEDPGISYTSIGINGAGLYSYLSAPNFQEQLTMYPPDMFVFSVGTNDANVPYDKFRPEVYKDNLEKIMKMVLKANPNCALLLTVPNDAYYRKKNLNRNIAREREVIIELAQQYQMAVWDFYGVMGELGSSKTWLNNGLMQSDLVHFSSKGYQLKGQLLLDAFLKFFKQFEQLQ